MTVSKPARFPICCSTRLLIAILLCFCFTVLQMMTSNMGMAMVCMVNQTASQASGPNDSAVENPYGGELDWKPKIHGFVFSALSWGRMAMLLTGYWADKLNAKWLLVGSLCIAATATATIAFSAEYCYFYPITARLFIGIGEALLAPSANSLLTRWFPPHERSAAMGMITAGRQIGHLIILPTAGFLCASSFGGWRAIFYVSAGCAIFYVVFWAVLGADKPSHSSIISEKEKLYIETLIEQERHSHKRKHRSVPWISLLTSLPVWSCVLAVVCHEFPLMTLFNFLPQYLRDVWHLNPIKNGFYSALPTASLLVGKLMASPLAGWFHRHNIFCPTRQCKVFNSVGALGISLFMGIVTMEWCTKRPPVVVLFFCLAMFCAGLQTPGCLTALVHMAPAFSGTITGVAFFFVSLAGVANPLIIKAIAYRGTQEEWNTVFYISSGVAAIPLIVFNLWGDFEVQSWAKGESKESQVHPA